MSQFDTFISMLEMMHFLGCLS